MESVIIKIDIRKRYEEIEGDLLYRLKQAWGLQGLKHHIYCDALTYQFLESEIDKLNYRPRNFMDIEYSQIQMYQKENYYLDDWKNFVLSRRRFFN